MENLLPPGNAGTKLQITLPWYVPGIIGASLILAVAVGSWTFYAVRMMDNVITVTGSAKQHVTADSVKWHLNISTRVTEGNMASGYPILARQLALAKDFLKANNIPDTSLSVSTVYVEQIYKNNDSGPQEYNLRQEITVQSSDVTKIDALSKDLSPLTSKGVFVSGNNLEFFVSTLPDLRVSLLADAVKDAKARATELAKAGGQSVGALKSASSGVVQVLAPNSVEISDYGTYDTSSIEKDVMVTARATFFVR